MGDWIPDHRCDCSVRDDVGAASSASRTTGMSWCHPWPMPASFINVGRFSEGQRRYLRFHRESVLQKSKYLDEP